MPPPVVIRAAVDRVEPDRLLIRGTNFGVTTTPIVMLAEHSARGPELQRQEIVARLPLDVPAARYRLQVLVPGGSSSPFVEIALEPLRRPC